MSGHLVVVGTDTDVGKTVFAAALTGALGASYWKPVQAGLDEETDTEVVRRLAALPPERVLDEAYRLHTPASPHIAAEIDGVEIDTGRLTPPRTEARLIIEAAGGLAVPLTRRTLFIDLIADWGLPVVLVGRTALGAINHALLSLEALRARDIPVLGIVFAGDSVPDTERTIASIGQVKRLGRLPFLDPLTPESLRAEFAARFQIADFRD